jgi:hypothetical protein
MPVTTDHYAAAFLGLAAILTMGCGDSTGPATQTTGVILISVSTTSASADVDPDGYALSIDGQPGQPVGVNANVTMGALLKGTHLVRLDGVASNCSVSGLNPRSVYVFPDQAPLPVYFSVSCGAKGDGGAGYWDY